MGKYCTDREATGENKAKNTHLEYVILTAFLLQQWLHKRVSMLRYITLPVLFLSLSLTILILPRFLSDFPVLQF